ncbi:MAG: hypothetical protein HYZ00_07455 [Candidatus Hydrogenedentes bacterium]|nr:hypothetical protein [Candidatus Hydrogenedentota bacterium]
MIKINLLPDHLRPIQRTPLPYIASFVVLGVVVAGLISVFITQRAKLSGIRTELASEQAALAKLQDIVNEANVLAEKKLGLQTKIQTIQDILSDRIVWSEQLYRLTSLTPDNIWYHDINVVWETFPEEVVETDPKTHEPVKDPKTGKVKTKRTKVKKPVLEVSGYVVDDEAGRQEVFPLTVATVNDPEFSKYFTLLQPRLKDTEFNGFQVRDFTLPYLIGTGGTG